MEEDCVKAMEAWISQVFYYKYKIGILDQAISIIDDELSTGCLHAASLDQISSSNPATDSRFARKIIERETLEIEKEKNTALMNEIWKSVDCLPEEDRAILNLRYGRHTNKKTYQEIGDLLYMSKDTVLRKSEKALLKLSKHVFKS